MTADDGMNPERRWDDARIALGRVAKLFNENDYFDLEELRRVENYALIPEEVRETLEDLSPDERQLLKRIFITLRRNHFYVESDLGGLNIPY